MKEKEFFKVELKDGVAVITTNNISIDSIVSDMIMDSIVSRLLGNGDKKLYNSKSTKYIDLGLPSGTKWASDNEEGYYTYDYAVATFGYKLPTQKQLRELKNKCRWEWESNKKGYTVTGPNGNSIFFTAAGFRGCDGNVHHEGSDGFYWSSTPYGSSYAWSLDFNSDEIYTDYYDYRDRQSVRLVK